MTGHQLWHYGLHSCRVEGLAPDFIDQLCDLRAGRSSLKAVINVSENPGTIAANSLYNPVDSKALIRCFASKHLQLWAINRQGDLGLSHAIILDNASSSGTAWTGRPNCEKECLAER